MQLVLFIYFESFYLCKSNSTRIIKETVQNSGKINNKRKTEFCTWFHLHTRHCRYSSNEDTAKSSAKANADTFHHKIISLFLFYMKYIIKLKFYMNHVFSY